ncbi:MAG: RNA methyltransferase [bacterium]
MLTDERIQTLQDVAAHRLRDVIVLENIHDPHNAAAALRNCDAFGIQEVHVIFETEKMFNPEKLGKLTSASANKWLTIKTWKTTEECFSELKNRGYAIIATAIDTKAVSFNTFEPPITPCAIVFGNEGFGITETAKKRADMLLYIPMCGFVDSLNLSVSVGIVTHFLRMKRDNNAQIRYSQEEATALADKWICRDEKQRRRV